MPVPLKAGTAEFSLAERPILLGRRRTNINNYSTLLFARPSFTEGVARTLDMGATMQEYNQSLTPEQADANALHADWRAVGDDIRRAIQQFRDEHAERLNRGK